MVKTSAIAQQEKEAVPVKSLPGSDLFERVRELSNAVAHRAFELFNGRGRTDGHDLEDWSRAESELLHPVHVDLAESADAFTVHAEVPGFSAKELEVGVEPHRLTISGKRASSKERTGTKMIYKEQCSTQIYRAIDLPAEVDASKVTATLKNGVLELSMPKAAKAIKVQIEQKAA
ncbi:MAG: Hsp20 family protein [Terriglobia bacterium]|jgi:HSP20 family protein